MVVARTQGAGTGFLQLMLEPGWELKRRAYNGRNLGHVYLYRATGPVVERPSPHPPLSSLPPLSLPPPSRSCPTGLSYFSLKPWMGPFLGQGREAGSGDGQRRLLWLPTP
jgi:hypothetical protein